MLTGFGRPASWDRTTSRLPPAAPSTRPLGGGDLDLSQEEGRPNTLKCLIHGFGAGRQSIIFEVLAAPAARKPIPEGGGLRPPPFGIVCWAAGAAQTPKIDDLLPAQKPIIENQSISPRSCLRLQQRSRYSQGASTHHAKRIGFDRFPIQSKIRSQTARASGTGNLGPDFGPQAIWDRFWVSSY